MIEPNNSQIERLKTLLDSPDARTAVKLLCRHIAVSLNSTVPPVSLKTICDSYKLKVVYNNRSKKEDSFLKLAPYGFEIELSKQKNWRRNRFTIAHELTHLILFNYLNTPITSLEKKYHDEVEMLCDVGASEILVNEIELEKILKGYGVNPKTLKLLYDKFLVSYDTLFWKLANFFKINISIWKPYARHSGEHIEFRVLRHFPNYKYSNKSSWLPSGCTQNHLNPKPFDLDNIGEKVWIFDNLEVIMKSRSVACSGITFKFPHSRTVINTLPTFETMTVKDETIYDDSFVLFIFSDKSDFISFNENYLNHAT